jgi:prevent-host-death family protein
MAEKISLREANQRFAQIVRAVEGGAEYVVTRHGEPVVRIVPAKPAKRVLTPEQQAALERTRERMDHGYKSPPDAEPFDRAKLHER